MSDDYDYADPESDSESRKVELRRSQARLSVRGSAGAANTAQSICSGEVE
jgi:hypothetical protein